MIGPLLDDPDLSPDDRWAMEFFGSMLHERLSIEDFEAAIAARWGCRDIVVRAPRTTAWLHEVATRAEWNDAGYAHASPELGFRSHFLVGVPGRPGAVYIEAPAETGQDVGLQSLNRPLHQHDSGRMGIITSGRAVFHVVVESGAGSTIVDCAVESGDIVFWPAWTAHTFDALDGFSLITAMADYVSPAVDGFVFPVAPGLTEHPRIRYSDYRTG